MSSRFVVFAGFVIFTASALSAEPTTRPARGDTLVVSAIIDAPADEIFECFRTSEGIVKAWGVAQAKVDSPTASKAGDRLAAALKPFGYIISAAPHA